MIKVKTKKGVNGIEVKIDQALTASFYVLILLYWLKEQFPFKLI